LTAANPGVTTTVDCGLTLTVIEPPTVPSAATIELKTNGDVEVNTPVIFSIQTRSADGVARAVADDIFTATLTCTDPDREQVYSVIADHLSSGLYTAVFAPASWCDYDLLITMVNANTSATGISTIVSDEHTVSVVDSRTVPAASMLVYSPPKHTHVGQKTSFVMQSASEDGRAQAVSTDVYSVAVRCIQQ